MSLTSYEPAIPRLHRSELAVPASNPRMIEKASASAADVIFLDLEDSVAPDDKPRARKNVVAARDIPAGRVLTREDLTTKRTGGIGLLPSEMSLALGRPLRVAVPRNTPITSASFK